jgi:signal transduction histidine kinase
MNARPGTLLAVAVVATSLALGTFTLAVGRVDIGVQLVQSGVYVQIASVAHDSPAQLEGFVPGMIVVSINNTTLLRLPQYTYPDGTPVPPPIATPEPAPTPSPAVSSPAPSAGPSPDGSPTASNPTSSAAASSPVASPGSSPSPVSSASPVPSQSSLASPEPTTTLAPTPAREATPTSEPTPLANAVPGGAVDNGGGTGGAVANPTDGPTPVLDPPVPTPAQIDPTTLNNLLTSGISELQAITPFNLEHESGGNGWTITYLGGNYVYGLPTRLLFALLAGCLILAAGVWLLASGRAGASVRPLAVPLAVATATPFLVWPLLATWFGPAVALAGVLLPLGMVPLADALAERIQELEIRRAVRIITAATATGAIVIGLMRLGLDASNFTADWARLLLVGAIPLVPGVAAAVPIARTASLEPGAGAGPVRSAELAVAGATPVLSLATMAFLNPLLLPLSAWLAGIAVAGRFTVRPLARLLSRAQLQRDLVVAATEAERARVAADIHDDALQELTLLVRRLDGAGDAEGAAMGRGVIERLRAICGDLRLPLLDDLGVGPALDWLVRRIETLAGGEVRLERSDGVRPPPDVELAFFRVAQEALANAARHGKPPIVVRYHATEDGAVLSVDDAGPGIAPGAADLAERAGRFGLLNMRQRAEQIDAILDVRPWPGGGTHVGLQWRPH